MNGHIGQSVAEVYQDFILAKTAESVSDITITCLRQEYYLHPVMQFPFPALKDIGYVRVPTPTCIGTHIFVFTQFCR